MIFYILCIQFMEIVYDSLFFDFVRFIRNDYQADRVNSPLDRRIMVATLSVKQG